MRGFIIVCSSSDFASRLAYYTEVEMSLTEALGTKVKICEGKKTNTLQIAFEDKDQLEGILRLMAVK